VSHSSQNNGDIFGYTPSTVFKPSLEHSYKRLTPSSIAKVESSLMNAVMLDLNRAEKIGSQKFPCLA
jgi:hypothetical protein